MEITDENNNTPYKPPQNFNEQILQQLKKHITENPTRLIMGNWVLNREPGCIINDYGARVPVPECGTVGCAATWINILDDVNNNIPREKFDGVDIDRATEILNVDYTQTYKLFYIEHWPYKLYNAFENETDLKKRAETFCKAVDWFILGIKTNDWIYYGND